MRRIQIIIGGKEKEFTGPNTWAEVDPVMAVRLFNLVKVALTKKHLLYAVPMLLYKIPLSTLKLFIDARISARKYQAGDDDENPETFLLMGEDLLESCKWVYSEDPPTTWLLKHINVGSFLKPKFLDACADRLHGLTFGEFIFTETFAARDPAKLCAVLYRKRSWWPRDRKRGAFIHDDIERFAKVLGEQQFNTVRNLVAWNYAGMVKHLHRTFTHVFAPPGELDLATETSNAQWVEAALAFTDNDSQKFHALEQEDLYLALKMINNRIAQNKERERERNQK
jgi:hypothetical protein